MADDNIQIEIVLDDGSVQKGFINLENKARESASRLDDIFGGITKGELFGIATVANIAADAIVSGFNRALSAVQEFASESIKAAIEQEDATRQLNIALANTGILSTQASQSMQDFASQLQQTTRYSDESILATSALIQNLARLDESGLKNATKAAVDLSSALGIDLNTAAFLVGKAAEGNIATFKRYGLAVKEGQNHAETFANAIGFIESRFGGTAQAQVNTYSGAIARLSNTFNDFQEEIGNIVVKSPAVIAAIQLISEKITELTETVKQETGSGDLFAGFLKQAIQVGAILTASIIAPLEIIANVGSASFKALEVSVQVLIVGFASLGDAVVRVLDIVGLAPQSLVDTTNTFLESTRAQLDTFLQQYKGAASGLFETPNADGIQSFLADFQNAVVTATSISTQLSNGTKKGFDDLSKNAIDAAKKINDAYRTGVVNTISAGVQSIGASLVRGAGAFSDFGKQILGIIGDIAIQIGTTLISIGLGIDALKTALATLSGGVAIAAGFALIALGGVLKSLSGGAGLGGVANGSTSSSGGPATTEPSPFEPEPSKPQDQTKVQVIVQGSILDSRETGLRIAEIINDSFDKNGTILAGA